MAKIKNRFMFVRVCLLSSSSNAEYRLNFRLEAIVGAHIVVSESNKNQTTVCAKWLRFYCVASRMAGENDPSIRVDRDRVCPKIVKSIDRLRPE